MIKKNSIQQSDRLREIRYLDRDFNGLKDAMNAIIVNFFPDAGTDFSEGSGTQILVELIAMGSDILAFYTDKSFNEMFLSRSVESKNIYDLAAGLGYQPKPISPSVADLIFSFDLPVTGSTTSQFFFNMAKGAKFKALTEGVTFENLEPIIFNRETSNLFNSVVLTRADNYVVTRFTKTIKVVSGETKYFSNSITNATPFKRIHIPERNVSEVSRVVDSENNEWFQVTSLAQEYLFTAIPNFSADSSSIPHTLTMKRVPRRCVTTFTPEGSVDITFGTGENDLNDTEFIMNPENLTFPNQTIGRFLNFSPDAISLNDFRNTTSLGVAPSNVTMFIQYRVGGGLDHNVGANLITKVENIDIQYYSNNITSLYIRFIYDSIKINNPLASQGGADAETIEEIRRNASYWYAAQQRVVSIEDYVVRAASMPPQYGSLYKIVAKHTKNQSTDTIDQITAKVGKLLQQRQSGVDDQLLLNEISNLNDGIKNNAADVTLYAITRDANGFLQKPTATLKQNVLTYLNFFKVASDTVAVEDVKILNLGCRFTIHTDALRFNPSEVLLTTILRVQQYLDISQMEVGKNINIDDLRKELKILSGVVSIPELVFYTISGVVDGRQYANDYVNPIDDFLSFNGTIIEIPQDTIAEVRFSKIDISGRFAD